MGEALEQRWREQAGPDHLQGDGTARVVLLRLVDRPHASLAQQAQDAVAADPRRQRRPAGGRGWVRGIGRFRRGADQGTVQEARSHLVHAQAGIVGQQSLHRCAEVGVARAGGIQQSSLLVRRQVGRLMKQRLDALDPPFSHPPSPHGAVHRRSAVRPARRGRSAIRA
jgi:hypothetical protein